MLVGTRVGKKLVIVVGLFDGTAVGTRVGLIEGT